MTWELFKDWFEVGSAYQARHQANYETIESALNNLDERLTGVVGDTGAAVPMGLQEIFDRKGLVGRESYSFTEGEKSTSQLVVLKGAYWTGDEWRQKTTSTTLSLSGHATGTKYINIDAAGAPALATSAGTHTVWQFAWDSATKIVSAAAIYTGVAVLFDGDAWQRLLTSVVKGTDYTCPSDRLEEIEAVLEAGLDIWGGFYAQDLPHDGLDFNYLGGLVRYDAEIKVTPAGTVTLTDDATNYIEVDPADGVVSANAVSFSSGSIPLYRVTVASGVMTEILDRRTPAAAGGWFDEGSPGGEGGGHTQNTDTHSVHDIFGIGTNAVGSPSGLVGIELHNGDDDSVIIGHNRDTGEPGWSPDGGTTWKPFFDLEEMSETLGAGRFIAIEDPPLVLSESGRGSTVDEYEELDLSAHLTQASHGCNVVALRVWFLDDVPTQDTNVRFRKAGAVAAPATALTAWHGADTPHLLLVEPDANGKVEYWVEASGAATATVVVYLLGYEALVVAGADGEPGADGSKWYNGEGAPAGELGVDGDYYLRTSNGDVYEKQSGSWVIIGNLKGEPGESGATTRIPHTWAIDGEPEVTVYPGFTVSLPSGQTAALPGVHFRCQAGTSATFSLRKNGSAITEFTDLTVSTTPDSEFPVTPVALADGDYIDLEITAVDGAEGVSITAYLDNTV
jgi:hypothetical protein